MSTIVQSISSCPSSAAVSMSSNPQLVNAISVLDLPVVVEKMVDAGYAHVLRRVLRFKGVTESSKALIRAHLPRQVFH